MKKDKIQEAMRLYLVTDRRWIHHSLYEDVEEAIKGGVTCVQMREKHLDISTFINDAKDIKKLCLKYGVPFIVNDNVEVMLAVDADGIHVGQHDMQAKDVRKCIGPDKILGVSAQTVEQAIQAYQAGADYLGVGAVFSTSTKDDAVEVSIQTLQKICQSVPIPVIAIGGIDMTNILKLKKSGIKGVAVVSAIMAQDDIQKATMQLKEKALLL
ncbi:thiamine phosphate synthase [Candidatus Stoquefichus massiliensis]|uniref:thiamine phosphate synthase n=1 Tax=Candidatus Stoquefichus massiliensis TaxID=1470350 RepID=UPI0004817633|nr:thiamine phosphate synthase [Candidatus Stoquefichus massiliensis]